MSDLSGGEAAEARPQTFFVRAVYSYTSQDTSSLSFAEGDIIEVLTQQPSGWWDGVLNGARGWFPSNYVEVVDDEDFDGGHMLDFGAEDDEEVDVYQQHDVGFSEAGHMTDQTGLESALSLSTATYPTNGDFSSAHHLSQDLDALRNLMIGDQAALLGGDNGQIDDAFERLAEAAMVNSANTANARPRTDAEFTSVDDQMRNADIDLGSVNSRSTSGSREASPGPGSSRHRPRATTGLDADKRSDANYPLRDRSSSTGTQAKRRAAQESDYWVPKVNDRGEIVYYNTRTGAETTDLPDDLEAPDNLASPSAFGDEDDAALGTPSPNHAVPVRGGEYFEKVQSDIGPGLLLPGHLIGGKPASFLRDENDELEFQRMLQPQSKISLGKLLDQALDAISQLIDIASEPVDPMGLSVLDRRLGQSASELLERGGVRLGIATSQVVHSVRDLLYCAGTLNVSPTDLATIAELASLVPLGSRSAANSGAVAAFAGAVVAMHSRPKDMISGNGTPNNLRTMGGRTNSLLSKVVLSARAVTEQPGVRQREKEGEQSQDVLERRIEKLNTYRYRVREDALELGSTLELLGNDLDRQGAADGDPGWSRRLHGTLSAGTGAAGISRTSLSGGSSAGWRGSGFVLPSAIEAAALTLDSRNALGNYLELSKDARTVLTSGKENMRRRPGQVPTHAFLDERIAPQLESLHSQIDSLTQLLHEDSPSDGVSQLTAGLSSLGLSGHTLKDIDEETSSEILVGVKQLLVRFGTFIALVEDLDFASVLDVEDIPFDANDAMHSNTASLASAARKALQNFESSKQGCYDTSTGLLIEAQDLSQVSNGHPVDYAAVEGFSASLGMLRQLSMNLVQIAHSLSSLSEEQTRAQAPNIGARSKIYGVDAAMTQSAAVFAPQSASRPTSAPVPLSPKAPTNAPNAFDAGTRERSGSVPTGGPAGGATNLSQKARIAAARKVAGRSDYDFDEDDEGLHSRAQSRGSSKLKRLLGDDGPNMPLSPGMDGDFAPRKPETPWFLEPESGPDDLILTPEGQVKGATLTALMERLTNHNVGVDSTFNNTFLMTYRSFTTTKEFIDLLFARFHLPPPDELTEAEHKTWKEKKLNLIRVRVIGVLKSWVESFVYEGEDNDQLERVKIFAGEVAAAGMTGASKQLTHYVERRQGEGEQKIRKMFVPTSAPAPILPKSRNIKFLDIDPIEMARQLTLLESKLFNKIRPVECLGKAWSKPNSEIQAKGIKSMISTSNRITGWVAEAILVQDDLKKRAAWIKQFIAIADACRSLNNFSTMTAIVSALQSASVHRLKRSWDVVNQRYVAILESILRMISSSKNFADYREMIHKLNPPCVPFLGVYLTDLTFIEDGNADRLKTDDRLINFGKRQKTAEVIREIMIYQSTPYNLNPVAGIQKFIEDNLVEARSDTELWQQSLLLEPREREDEKISRLLSESGFL